jgi:hypothetical protein
MLVVRVVSAADVLPLRAAFPETVGTPIDRHSDWPPPICDMQPVPSAMQRP